MFATVYVDEETNLPHFPEAINGTDMSWQCKQGLDVYSGPYKITAKGRLQRKEQSHREKTGDEKQAEAEKWGFDTWESYVNAYEEFEDGLYPTEVEYDEDNDDERPPSIMPTQTVVDETWWADHNVHGTFEFHQVLRQNPIEYETVVKPDGEEVKEPSEYELDVYLQYEARFTQGNLDEIVFMGERMGDKSIEETIEEIEEWENR